jgi:hypothetical protein
MTIFYCFRFKAPPNLEGHVPRFISPMNKVAQLYPQTLDSLFVAFYDSKRYSGGIQTHLYMGNHKESFPFDPCYIASGQTTQIELHLTDPLLHYDESSGAVA